MLTSNETINTRNELQENYKRLGESEDVVLNDLQISRDELHAVLNMTHPYPGNVWMLRDYLEDKLKEQGIPMIAVFAAFRPQREPLVSIPNSVEKKHKTSEVTK